MTAIHGARILLFKGATSNNTITYTLIGGQKNVTINFKSDTVETSVKADFPSRTYMSSWMSWDCSFDGVFVDPTNSGTTTGNYDKVLHDLAVGDEITVGIQKRVKTGPDTYDDIEIYHGQALITEFSVEAGQDDVSTFSCSLQGTGDFSYIAPAQPSSSSTSQTPA